MLDSTLETDILSEIHERTIKNFMNILILAELRKRYPVGGYDFIALIHRKFQIMISSGTVYSVLYSLERDGLIKGMQTSNKRVYELTDKGEETIEAILKNREKIQNFMSTLL